MSGLIGLINIEGRPLEDRLYQKFWKSHLPSLGDIHPPEVYRNDAARITVVRSNRLSEIVRANKADNQHNTTLLFGELFNPEFQASGDTIALCDAYQKEGVPLLNRLDGSFCLAVVEDAGNRITIVCDRTASQALFYTVQDDLLGFSYSLKPLLTLFKSIPRVASEAVASFLACGFILQGQTLVSGIRVLGPGQLLSVNHGRLVKRKYWQHSFSPKRLDRPLKDRVAELADLIKHAVDERTSGIPRFGVLLSGGYDSRAILGCITELTPDIPPNTITWGDDASKPESDAAIAFELASKLGAQHHFYPIKAALLPQYFRQFVQLNEGRTDAVGNYPGGLNIFESIREELEIDFILRGDEIFGWRKEATDQTHALHTLDIHDLKNLPNNYDYLKVKYRRRLASASSRQIKHLLEACPYEDVHDIKDHVYFNERLFGYLNSLNHLKEREIWVRNPFIDNEILDFIVRVPTELRLGKRLFVETVKAMFPELIKVPIARYPNLIDWNARIETDQTLQTFIRQVLINDQNGFDEIINRYKLEAYLDSVFERRWGSVGAVDKAKPSLTKKVQNRLSRNLGFYTLSISEEIFRLMIVKIFCDEFLGGECNLD